MPTKKPEQRTSVSTRAGTSRTTNNKTSVPPSANKKAVGKKGAPQKSGAKKSASANKAATVVAARANESAGKQTASKKQSAAKKQTPRKTGAASKPAARQGLFAKTRHLAGEIIVGAVTGAARGAVKGAVEPLEEAAGITAVHHDEGEENEEQKESGGHANKT